MIFTSYQTLLAKVTLPRPSSRGNLNLSDQLRIDPGKLSNIASRSETIRAWLIVASSGAASGPQCSARKNKSFDCWSRHESKREVCRSGSTCARAIRKKAYAEVSEAYMEEAPFVADWGKIPLSPMSSSSHFSLPTGCTATRIYLFCSASSPHRVPRPVNRFPSKSISEGTAGHSTMQAPSVRNS